MGQSGSGIPIGDPPTLETLKEGDGVNFPEEG